MKEGKRYGLEFWEMKWRGEAGNEMEWGGGKQNEEEWREMKLSEWKLNGVE